MNGQSSKEVGKRILSRRKALKLTQKALSQKTGISHVTISKWEKGETNTFKEPYFSKLAEALQTTGEWLLYGEGDGEKGDSPIIERIFQRMDEIGMSQSQLARKAKITKGAVHQWKKGLASPSGENLVRVAKALEVTPEWLVFGEKSNEFNVRDRLQTVTEIENQISLMDTFRALKKKTGHLPPPVKKAFLSMLSDAMFCDDEESEEIFLCLNKIAN